MTQQKAKPDGDSSDFCGGGVVSDASGSFDARQNPREVACLKMGKDGQLWRDTGQYARAIAGKCGDRAGDPFDGKESVPKMCTRRRIFTFQLRGQIYVPQKKNEKGELACRRLNEGRNAVVPTEVRRRQSSGSRWQFDHRNERPKKERRMRETHQHKRGKQRIKLCERMDFSISARCAFSSVRRTSYRIKLS